ncbi:hypothetical protein HYDPIDRAFT_176864 [Hydnomerulius pinastri MD-312]|uniref:FAD-binding domain-containing protein n=1 Tax=Hydnomerulius pinastri MD-312 TaxID=994086 RepID=A0A0C9WC28_9AGAM|nr:hypothetical protein HYDPIDRAFT_176864 [Hydnomerulius pinastri MD-312]
MSSSAEREKFRVAICGGGIGGLTLAVVLGNSNCSVDLYESESEITTVGAGISLFARATEIMQELGLLDELSDLATQPPQPNTGPRFRKADQTVDNVWFQKIFIAGPLHLHRRDLIDVLLRHIPPTTRVHLNKKMTSWFQDASGSIHMQFADASSSEADVLVGADGIRSVTRRCMYRAMAKKSEDESSDIPSPLRRYVDPLWTGILAYRSLIPMEKLKGIQPDAAGAKVITYHLVTYPVARGQFLNVVIFCHVPDAFDTAFPYPGRWVADVEAEEVAEIVKRFAHWEPEVQTVLQAVERPSRWALHIVRKLPHFVSGSTAILGDAAHAMEPHFGAGAAQAIEDAFILGRLLSHNLTSKSNIEAALRVYETIRLPFAQDVVQASQNVGRLLTFKSPANDGTYLPHQTVNELDGIRHMIEDEWEWQNSKGSVLEWERAERKLRELLS